MKKKVCMMLVLTMVMSLFIASFAAASPPSHSQVNKDLAQLRQATVQYQDIEKAIDDGYNDPHNCIPGMGIHLINPDILGTATIEKFQPEVLLYEPKKNGGYRLVGVEYIAPHELIDETPWLFNREFDKGSPPPAYEGAPGNDSLHVWIWQGNPEGMFNNENPNVGQNERCGENFDPDAFKEQFAHLYED